MDMPDFIWALSVRQPYAWAIVNGVINIEHRPWPTEIRGRVLIHAGKDWYKDSPQFSQSLLRAWGFLNNFQDIPLLQQIYRGGIVGSVVIDDCIETDLIKETYRFVLSGAKPLPFLPMRGQPKFFKVYRQVAVIPK